MLSLLVITPVFAAVQPTEEWSKAVTVTRPTNIYGMPPTSDGGAILAGLRTVADTKSGILIKVDASGAKAWEKTYSSDRTEMFFDVKQTSDGGYIAVGTKYRALFDSLDLWLVKLSSTGVVEWEKLYGGTEVDKGFSVIKDSNGDFVWTGYHGHGSELRLYYGKTSSSGETIHSIFTLNPSSGMAQKIIEASTGGYVITGGAIENDELGEQMVLMKLDTSLSKEWVSYHGFSGDERAYDVIETQDGDFVLAGIRILDDTYSPWVAKFSPSGEKLQATGFIKYDKWYGRSIIQLETGSYVVSGYVYDGEYSLYVAGLDSELSMSWDVVFDDPDLSNIGMALTEDGGLLIAGNLPGEIDKPYLLKTTSVLDPVGSIKVTIKDASGAVMDGVQVKSTNAPFDQTALEAETTNHGISIFNDVLTGDYAIHVSKDGYISKWKAVAVTEGVTAELVFTLISDKAQLTVDVVDGDGSPISGAYVGAMTKTNVGINGYTDADGSVSFISVTPGTHSIQVSAKGYVAAVSQVECVAGELTELTMVLAGVAIPDPEPEPEPEPEPVADTFQLTFHVVDVDGSPFNDVQVNSVTVPDGQAHMEGFTDGFGRTLFDVLVGEYEFQLTKEAHEPQTVAYTVTGDELLEVVMVSEELVAETPEEPEEPEPSVDTTEEPEVPDSTVETPEEPDSTTDTSDEPEPRVTVPDSPDGVSPGNNNLLLIGVAVVVMLGVVAYYLKTKGYF